jgi:5-methyltetrahydrofolate--homocysteine methyltransferase
MKAGMEVLRPLLTSKKDAGSQGTVVMGTVKGDLHDIGKNLVGMMAEGAGFTIVNLGTDTSADEFIRAAAENDADVIGMSALLTTTMIYMKTVVDTVRARGVDVKLAVGGAPVTQKFASEIGADGYAADAASAVELFKRLVAARKEARSR